MASAPLTFSSSLTITLSLSQYQKRNPCFSCSNFGFPPPFSRAMSLHKPVFCPVTTAGLAFSLVTKSSESKEPVNEIEADVSRDEGTAEVETSTPVVLPAEENPKREEIFAVVMVGGRQYIVFPGRYIYVQRLRGAEVSSKITLNKVLLVGTKTKTWIGLPVVANAVVHAIVEEQGLNDKVIVYKYKRKKNYRRNIGHRQPNSRIRITGITGYENSPFDTLDTSENAAFRL